jgi:hypothetical protein
VRCGASTRRLRQSLFEHLDVASTQPTTRIVTSAQRLLDQQEAPPTGRGNRRAGVLSREVGYTASRWTAGEAAARSQGREHTVNRRQGTHGAPR